MAKRRKREPEAELFFFAIHGYQPTPFPEHALFIVDPGNKILKILDARTMEPWADVEPSPPTA